jgi:hypothetical protein
LRFASSAITFFADLIFGGPAGSGDAAVWNLIVRAARSPLTRRIAVAVLTEVLKHLGNRK